MGSVLHFIHPEPPLHSLISATRENFRVLCIHLTYLTNGTVTNHCQEATRYVCDPALIQVSSLWESAFSHRVSLIFSFALAELQQQYTSYKNNLQQLAQRIGEVEQETEEHKCVILQRPLEVFPAGKFH